MRGEGEGVYPASGGNGGGGVPEGGDLRLPAPEHNHIVHYDRDNYGPVYGGKEASKVTSGQLVVGAGMIGIGGDMDISLEGRTGRGGGNMNRRKMEA